MTHPLLALHNLRKSYGATIAVDGVSFELRKGELLSLLGPSGSGKTTTLQMIAGLVPPTSGSILLDGRSIDPLPPHKRNIGVVFQNYALFPHLTATRNIGFPLEMRRIARSDVARRVDDALQLVGLSGYGERLPRQLSGGQQQRVALARALVFEPDLLLMDEPLGALDRKLREQMQTEIKRLHRELGMSIIYVTHDQDEALTLSDRIAVFNAGRVEQIGTPADVYENPRTRFIAEFIGEANVFNGRIVSAVDGLYDIAFGNIHIRARPVAGSQQPPGSQIALAIRPEKIRVSSTEPSGLTVDSGQINRLPATVRDVIYQGRFRRFVLEAESGVRLTALETTIDGGAPIAAIGSRVQISWRVHDAICLDR